MLSVICPIYNEEKYISKCIESILSQDYPKDDLEVIFADGMSTDRTREIISAYTSKYPWIKLIDNFQRIVPPALNKAIKISQGEIILRLDAHASYPSNYFSSLVNALKRTGADNVGAVCKTEVLNQTPKALAIRAVLSHPLGVGNSSFRTGISTEQETETVPFGCWPRSAFEKYGYFDERLKRNQDIELNKRITRGGGKIIIIPDTYSIYYARESFQKIARNNYGNGLWNILTVWYTNNLRSLSLRHFIPLLFVLSILVPCILSIWWHKIIFLAILSLLCYLIVIALTSIKLSVKYRLNWLYLVMAFSILHFSYGIGSLVGILKIPFLHR
ncbi:MAG: glycosyltransferase family 2 protein [Muribaculaceae bacterium]|nr:glycosyltransferase family 2 protein [Muribaculaceae bacterium]